MRTDSLGVVKGLVAAWTLQDVDATLAYIHEDADYSLNNGTDPEPSAVVFKGRHDIGRVLQRFCQDWDILRYSAGPWLDDGTTLRGQVAFSYRHRESGEVFEGTKRIVWRVDGRKVVACDEYIDGALLTAFLRMARSRISLTA